MVNVEASGKFTFVIDFSPRGAMDGKLKRARSRWVRPEHRPCASRNVPALCERWLKTPGASRVTRRASTKRPHAGYVVRCVPAVVQVHTCHVLRCVLQCTMTHQEFSLCSRLVHVQRVWDTKRMDATSLMQRAQRTTHPV